MLVEKLNNIFAQLIGVQIIGNVSTNVKQINLIW
jgi:hypothetical protein